MPETRHIGDVMTPIGKTDVEIKNADTFLNSN